jgi:hypothetical protein
MLVLNSPRMNYVAWPDFPEELRECTVRTEFRLRFNERLTQS